MEAEINEFYLTNLQDLNSKLNYVLGNQQKGIKAFDTIIPELERLRLKAVEKIRDFFLKKIESFKAPNTNIALVQQNVLLKYKNLFWFLMEQYTPIGLEIHQSYIGVVSTYFLSSFERYYKAISLLQSPNAEKTDLIGTEEGRRTGLFGTKKDTKNVFSLGDRAVVLQRDDGIIVPEHHVGSKKQFEVIFKSLLRLLLDNSCSEYVFTCDFFNDTSNPSPHDSLNAFFSQTFEPTSKFIEQTVRQYVDNSFDALTILLCIRINSQNLRIMQKRRLPHLENFMNLLNIILWPRFQTIMGMHIDSFKKADIKRLSSREPVGHYVAKRYADIASAILALNQGYDDALLNNR